MTSSFYVYLPSNSLGAGNTSSSFTVRLPRTLEFNSVWSVALAGLCYRRSWHTIGTRSTQYMDIHLMSAQRVRVRIPSSTHGDKTSLLTTITEAVAGELASSVTPLFRRDANETPKAAEAAKKETPSKAVKVDTKVGAAKTTKKETGDTTTNPPVSENVKSQPGTHVGFTSTSLVTELSMAKHEVDLSGGINQLFVYCPGLIHPAIVGDTVAPILRIVNVNRQKDEDVEEIYVAPQYHKVRLRQVTEITIDVRLASGELVRFQRGRTVATLHFRKEPFF